MLQNIILMVSPIKNVLGREAIIFLTAAQKSFYKQPYIHPVRRPY